MIKELLFPSDCTAKQYLEILLEAYPYDIEESRVYAFLDTIPYASSYLKECLAYISNLPKFRLCEKAEPITSDLEILFQNLARIVQEDDSLLHLHPFDFDATIMLTHFDVSHPYAHLPLENIIFLQEVQLHHISLFHLPDTKEFSIIRKTDFIFRNVSIDAKDFFAMSISISDKKGIVYLPKLCFQLGVCLSSLYSLTPPSLTQDFILIFGLASKHNEAVYYYDETNQMYIGLVRGDSSMHHIRYLKDMIQTLYNSICMKKNDLPIHASMFNLSTPTNLYGMIFAGESGTGKSEIVDALTIECQKKRLDGKILFDDHGTWHYLDEEVVSTASSIGALKNITYSQIPNALSKLSNSLFLIQDNQEVYQILPLLSQEETHIFHKVTHIFYLDNLSDEYGYAKLKSLEECLDLFKKGPFLKHDHISSSYFINPYGCVQNKEVCEQLINDFFTNLFLQNIPIYVLYTKHARINFSLYEEYAHLILHEIGGNHCENKNETLY